MMIPKPKKYRGKKLTQSARGQSCTLRRPGICNHDSSTVVACHLPGNKGTGTKNHDFCIVFACSSCHEWLDERHDIPIESHHGWDVLRAFQETLIILLDKGLIKLV